MKMMILTEPVASTCGTVAFDAWLSPVRAAA